MTATSQHRIQNRVPRGAVNVYGLRMTQYREHIAKAIEAGSLIPYALYSAGALGSTAVNIGITPVVATKVRTIQFAISGTLTGTFDVQVGGVSILNAPINVATFNGGSAVVAGTVYSIPISTAGQTILASAGAADGIAAASKISIVPSSLVGTGFTLQFNLSGVHNAMAA